MQRLCVRATAGSQAAHTMQSQPNALATTIYQTFAWQHAAPTHFTSSKFLKNKQPHGQKTRTKQAAY
jgi:hypothetical protein